MIIQIRGTSGSGKSTVMKQVMEKMNPWYPYKVKGRKQPLYYIHDRAVVLGHYEIACGGCDTIGSARQVYDLIQTLDYRETGRALLCEGLLLSEDVKWSSQLPDLTVFFLTTPLDECIRRIKQRRQEAGNFKVLDTENTSRRVAVIDRARVKLLDAGVRCRRCSAEQAPGLILGLLKENGDARRAELDGLSDR